ncbi:MAG: lipoprotein releasing system, transrane protein, LolC/E family [Gammaproteobacteria bacterium]|nr:lipoprotein releasing system, transrane protein, LolC/E family [Gammaproteobacteria bacterium]
MFKPYELFIGLRYVRAKRRNHFISFVSLSSILGVTRGVTALIAVLSVMNGFEKEVQERTLEMMSHATLVQRDGELSDWQQVVQTLESHPGVAGAAPYAQLEGMLSRKDKMSGVLIRGIVPEP